MGYCKPFKRGVSWRSQNFGDNATVYGPHSGNDEAAPIGTPVHAAGDGVVEWAGEFDDTYHDNLLWLLRMGGNILVLNCGDAEPSFVYGHLHSFTVKRGDRVRKGQVIGLSGNTGTATTGAHLHVEAIPPGYVLNSPLLGRVNPDIYLTEWPEDINTGSLSYASETIKPLTPEGDELSAQEVQIIVDAINHAFHRTKTELPGDTTKAILDFKVDAEKTGGQINLGAFLAEYRHNNNRVVETTSEWILPEVVALRELVKQLSVAQGVTIDYEAIAKAVNDDAAKRMEK